MYHQMLAMLNLTLLQLSYIFLYDFMTKGMPLIKKSPRSRPQLKRLKSYHLTPKMVVGVQQWIIFLVSRLLLFVCYRFQGAFTHGQGVSHIFSTYVPTTHKTPFLLSRHMYIVQLYTPLTNFGAKSYLQIQYQTPNTIFVAKTKV